jgi:hypothetical protein
MHAFSEGEIGVIQMWLWAALGAMRGSKRSFEQKVGYMGGWGALGIHIPLYAAGEAYRLLTLLGRTVYLCVYATLQQQHHTLIYQVGRAPAVKSDIKRYLAQAAPRFLWPEKLQATLFGRSSSKFKSLACCCGVRVDGFAN